MANRSSCRAAGVTAPSANHRFLSCSVSSVYGRGSSSSSSTWSGGFRPFHWASSGKVKNISVFGRVSSLDRETPRSGNGHLQPYAGSGGGRRDGRSAGVVGALWSVKHRMHRRKSGERYGRNRRRRAGYCHRRWDRRLSGGRCDRHFFRTGDGSRTRCRPTPPTGRERRKQDTFMRSSAEGSGRSSRCRSRPSR